MDDFKVNRETLGEDVKEVSKEFIEAIVSDTVVLSGRKLRKEAKEILAAATDQTKFYIQKVRDGFKLLAG